MRKTLKLLLAFLLVALPLAAGWYVYPMLAVGCAYKAKITCSAIFISGRSEASVFDEDVHAGSLHLLDLFHTDIDHEKHTVTASFLGLLRRTAVHRERIGATLAIGNSPETLLLQEPPPPAPPLPGAPWPRGNGFDASPSPELARILDSAFAEPDPANPRRTRALAVAHRGHLIAEDYAPGFSRDTPLPGWSMTKSATNALTGILIRKGALSLEDDHLLERWNADNDPRSAITLDHIMRMSSGLDFAEDYENPRNDVTTMLFRSPDAAAFAAAKPLRFEPGTQWKYTSGTTNILSLVLRETIDDDDAYHALPYRELFHRIGMTTAILERDPAGNFVGSSFMYASARDWARLGLLYLNGGSWEGARILPDGWVAYSTSPSPESPRGIYGAHLWRRVIRERSDINRRSPLPPGAYHFCGHEGQFVTVVPEEDLVVVRLGLTLRRTDWDQEGFVAEVIRTLPDEPAPKLLPGDQ